MRWFAAAGIALCVVVIIAGLLGSNARRMAAEDIPLKGGQVEKVSVTKRFMQPNLAVNVPQAAVSAQNNAVPQDAPQIARTGKIDLYVGNVDKAAGTIGRVARENSGDVFSSDIAAADGSSQPSATMEIRVPASRFDEALSGIVQTGKVRERSISAQDLTSSITDSDARLRNLRQTEADIRHIMDRSGSVAQVMDAENQLSQVREQIETLEAQIKTMRTQVAYATIDIDLQAETAGTPVQPTAAAQLASAWQGAVASLQQSTIGLLAALLWVVAFVPYLLAVAALAWLVYARMRRTVRV